MGFSSCLGLVTGGTSRLKQGAIATKDRHNGEVYTTFIGRHLLCATIYAVSSAVMILAALCYQLYSSCLSIRATLSPNLPWDKQIRITTQTRSRT